MANKSTMSLRLKPYLSQKSGNRGNKRKHDQDSIKREDIMYCTDHIE